MSVWKKAMNYLGLGPDDAYDDYDAPIEPERPSGRAPRSSYGPDPLDTGTVRTVPARPGAGREPNGTPRVSGPGDVDQPAVSIRPRGTGSAVRAVPATSPKPHTVRPRRFDHAQEVADKFKEGQPVIMNLEGIEKDLTRRLIDFASGLCYALEGTLEKVASGVYLLTPANVSVSPEDRRVITERGSDD